MRTRAAFLLALVAGCGSPKSDAPPLGSSPQSDDASASGNPIPTQDAGQIDDATTFSGFDTGAPWYGQDAGFPVYDDAGHPPIYDATLPILECVPGESVECTGPGGCISNQVCNGEGTAFGACACEADSSTTPSCTPGDSIPCAGPYGCQAFEVCNASGSGFEACSCSDAGSFSDDAGGYDAYAPLPPPVGNQGYNAIWSESETTLFLPLFSAPSCDVVPPYGDSYTVNFYPSTIGPVGTFPACVQGPAVDCYQASRTSGGASEPGDVYTLSPFNGDGVASGQMNTIQGIVPLVVKYCQ